MTNDAGESTNVSIDETLQQRGARYGSFKNHAAISQELQRIFREGCTKSGNTTLDPFLVESVNMICHKLARIANGDPYYDDSWRDIAGYAQLVVDILNGKNT